jgi:hypothetical protein
MSKTRIESLIVGEIKISACLSADALADQHSPILRFLFERADFEGKPQLERTSKGRSTPLALNKLRSSVVAFASHCSLVFVILNSRLLINVDKNESAKNLPSHIYSIIESCQLS